ncbi:Aste57867_20753 [Aphanomyces stellatus]|uniref:Aste57867_20753 protein n=1 Tax=Aphanomyces stellatus TaxID=120398 RepID=A0A485LGZ3_9STRA|nr:hypothetical protein As57867_020685 [Aphanomyces stellatus]VFT97432.1 Aste57867_20753 [Aphanomyces stellatus]
MPTHSSNMIVRSGVLFKRGSGVGVFQRRNWKPRYFELSYGSLRYYDYHQGALRGAIDLSFCAADDIQVMPVDCAKTGRSDSTIWRIAINTPARRLLLSMETEADMFSWEASFRHVLEMNGMHRRSCPAVLLKSLSSTSTSSSFAASPRVTPKTTTASIPRLAKQISDIPMLPCPESTPVFLC